MIKTIVSCAIALSFVAPTAIAETRENIEVTIDYAIANSSTPTSIDSLIVSVEEQARDACAVSVSGSHIAQIDTDCVIDVTNKAIAKISDKHAEILRAESIEFARLITEHQTSFR